MHTLRRTLFSLVALGLLLTVSPAARAQAPAMGFADAVLGRWNVTVQGPDGAYPSWMEIQLRKETELMGRFVGQFGSQRHATRVEYANGFTRPSALAAKKPGEWQTYDITLVGRRVTVVLNGTTVIRDTEIPGITGGALLADESEPGPLMLQGDHGRIEFRKVIVTPAQ